MDLSLQELLFIGFVMLLHGINYVIKYVTLTILEHGYDIIAFSLVLRLPCELLQNRNDVFVPCFIYYLQNGYVLLLLIPFFCIFLTFMSYK